MSSGKGGRGIGGTDLYNIEKSISVKMDKKTVTNSQDKIPVKVLYDGSIHEACLINLGEDSASIYTGELLDIDESVMIECEPIRGNVIASYATVTKINQHIESESLRYNVHLRWDRLSYRDRAIIRQYTGIVSKRRKQQRYKSSLPGRMLHPIIIDRIKVVNVSEQGMFIATEIPIPPKTLLRFEIDLGNIPILFDSKVTHMVSRKNSGRTCRERGCGVSILQMQEKEKNIWSRYIMAKNNEKIQRENLADTL